MSHFRAETATTFPLAEALTLRYADDAHAIEAGVPNSFTEQVTPVTAELLRWWFQADHCHSRSINFHSGQRDALLAIIYAHEVLHTESLLGLYQAIAPGSLTDHELRDEVSRPHHAHAKYAAKMATGTGKTWVLNALLVWQFLNHRAYPNDHRFSSNFLIVSPGLIVYQRLLDSFQGKLIDGQRVFETSDVHTYRALFVPPHRRQSVFTFLRSAIVPKAAIGSQLPDRGMVALTNWHHLAEQLEETLNDNIDSMDDEPAVHSFFPLTPGITAGNSLEQLDSRRAQGRALSSLIALPHLVVFNDEAHHIHGGTTNSARTEVLWQKTLSTIAGSKPGRFTQIDFSATPFQQVGSGTRARKRFFPHIVVDFPLSSAMHKGLVKSLALDKRKEIAALPLDFSSEKDASGLVTGLSQGQRTMLSAGLKKLQLLESRFAEIRPDKFPKLLIMTEDTSVSPFVVEFLREQGLDDADILSVDSAQKRDMKPEEWAPIQQRLFESDTHPSPRVIVSVLMLREGFDVSNICVIVPLRSTSSNILLEQTVGRGLRLMWRGDESIEELKRENRERIRARREPSNLFDVLFVIEHPAFDAFYEELLDGGAAGAVTGDEPPTPIGDLEKVCLRPNFLEFDFEIPLILSAEVEHLAVPIIDVSVFGPTKYPLSDLLRAVGTHDIFSSHDVETGTQYGDFSVDRGVMTATGYNDYLARMAVRVTESVSRTFTASSLRSSRRYPLTQIDRPLVVDALDRYIRTELFGEPFDPHHCEAWRVLLIADVSPEIAAKFSALLASQQDTVPLHCAEVVTRHVSEATHFTARVENTVPVTKSIYPRLKVHPHSGGLERLFIAWADRDSVIEALVKVDEGNHEFLRRPYLTVDGMPANYSPDFLVRTGHEIYVVETKAHAYLAEPNVRRKQIAAAAWVEQINQLPPHLRSQRNWYYVLLSETSVHEGVHSNKRASEVLAQVCHLSTFGDTQARLI